MKSILFVDDEPLLLQGLERQFRDLRKDWDMHFAEGGQAALTLMERVPIEVIGSDMSMPGMDGAQLLGEVLARHPHTVRLVLSGHADRDAVLRLVGPAHQYLSKPCDPGELRGAISRALALRDLLANEHLKQLASKVKSLPALPALHRQLTAELGKEEPSLERVADLISHDVAMTSKILQLVNSAFFGLPEPAATPFEAASFLGLSTIRSLVLSIHIFSQFDSNSINAFSAERLARHGWRTAMAAKKIAALEHSEAKMGDQCFLAGLLHDIGQLVLAAGLPGLYESVLRKARSEGLPVWEAERSEFGATHAEVGAYLLGLWGLPNPVVEAVALHHRPAECLDRGLCPAIIVHVADALAHEQDADVTASVGPQPDRACLIALGLEGRLDFWKETIAAH